jgi:hypothetical protein
MSALEALAAAKAAGVKLTLDGDGIILETKTPPLPADVVALLKTAKSDLLRILEWREAAQTALMADPPSDASERRWAVAVGGLNRFVVDGWGDQAALMGWTKEELYRVPALWSQIRRRAAMSFASQCARLRREFGRAVAEDAVTIVAADFMHGGNPSFARIFDRKGVLLDAIGRRGDEPTAAFRGRALQQAREAKGGARVVLGGIGAGDAPTGLGELLRGAVTLPDVPLHPSQREAVALIERERRVALVCGRRWGKSTVIVTLAVDYALTGRSVGIFAPTFRFLKPLIDAVVLALAPLPRVSLNRTLGEIRLEGGGAIDFWSIDVTGRAARGRKYHLALVDEAAHDEGYLKSTLEAAITPALLDFKGKVVLASTPNGLEGAFWEAANMLERGYVVHHAPTSANPHLPPDEIAYLRSTLRPEIASQELDALFVDTGGATIFPLASLLIDGEPHPDDFRCDYLGLAIDSNSGKGGPDRDGCAAAIFAVTVPNISQGSLAGARVVIVDWDIQSLAQGGVAPWLQHVRELTMSWFYRLRPLRGLPQAHVEPAGNAYAIIETVRAQGLSPLEIDTKYVTLGKDGRALAVEPHVTDGRVKLSRSALDKRTNYRGVVANHLTRQVTGFRAFDKDAYRREDDLFDAAMYAVLVSLGDGTEARWSRLQRVPAIT